VLLSGVAVTPERVHRIAGEHADLERVAGEYAQTLRDVTGAGDAVPVVDLLMIGIGRDAHVLSLYPGCPEIASPHDLVAALRRPPMDPAVDRVTLTPPLIEAARHVMVLAHGTAKAAAVAAMVQGSDDPLHVPAQLVRRGRGRVTVLCDSAAAADLGSLR
jgi:6-phosphogluconolactonase